MVIAICMSKLLTIWGIIRRFKYLVVLIGIIVIVGFVDENSYWNRHYRKAEISMLKSEIVRYKALYEEDTRRLEELENNPMAIERMARERYFMQRDNEDVFIVQDEDVTNEESTTDTLLSSIVYAPAN